jgi:hypothetical protein
MTNSIYLIGNKNDFQEYVQNPDNISSLPVKNIPAAYFPFFYSSSESSVNKMKTLFPLFETNDLKTSRKNKSAQHNIDTEKLFASLSILEEDYQPYNNNNIKHITTFLFICFIILSMIVLKFINYFFEDTYIYIISGAITFFLVICLMWAFVITGNGI